MASIIMDRRCHLCGRPIFHNDEVVTIRSGTADENVTPSVGPTPEGKIGVRCPRGTPYHRDYYAIVHLQCAWDSIELHKTW